jgi:hypothetical protein
VTKEQRRLQFIGVKARHAILCYEMVDPFVATTKLLEVLKEISDITETPSETG